MTGRVFEPWFRINHATATALMTIEADGVIMKLPISIDPSALVNGVLELLRTSAVVTGPEITTHLGISPRSANQLAHEWLETGILEIEDPTRRTRKYRLSPHHERLVSP